MPSVAGILLAAGGGSRLGRPKALVEIGGQTLAARGAGLLRAGGADPVIVVTGAAPVDLPDVTLVTNPDWRTGMGSSLVAGLTAARDLPPDGPDGTASCGAVVIALADQPLVGAEAVRRLIAAHAAGATVAVAAYDGRARNPVLIGREHWDEVLATTTGDAGARPFLRAHRTWSPWSTAPAPAGRMTLIPRPTWPGSSTWPEGSPPAYSSYLPSRARQASATVCHPESMPAPAGGGGAPLSAAGRGAGRWRGTGPR